MLGKYCSVEEKAHIIMCRQENVLIRMICKHTGWAKLAITKLLAAARGLLPDVILEHMFSSER